MASTPITIMVHPNHKILLVAGRVARQTGCRERVWDPWRSPPRNPPLAVSPALRRRRSAPRQEVGSPPKGYVMPAQATSIRSRVKGGDPFLGKPLSPRARPALICINALIARGRDWARMDFRMGPIGHGLLGRRAPHIAGWPYDCLPTLMQIKVADRHDCYRESCVSVAQRPKRSRRNCLPARPRPQAQIVGRFG